MIATSHENVWGEGGGAGVQLRLLLTSAFDGERLILRSGLFTPLKEPQVAIDWEAERASGSLWTFQRRENSHVCRKSKQNYSFVQPLTTAILLSRIPWVIST